jgi:hypothetical protein
VVKRAAGLLCLALAVAGCGGDDEETKQMLPPGRTIVATGELLPRTSLFGDPVTARVVVAVDRRRIDPDELALNGRFTPYERVGDVEVQRRDVGHETQLVYTVPLRCDEFACLPREGRATFRFKPARLGAALVRWPALEVGSRINLSEQQALRFRANLAPLPESTSRVSPTLVAIVAFSLAGVLTLLAGFLVARVARRAWRRKPALDLPPVERALLLLEWTRNRVNGMDRRRALELLAGALEGEDRRELAGEARALAWSDDSPSPEQATRLARRVKEARGPAG